MRGSTIVGKQGAIILVEADPFSRIYCYQVLRKSSIGNLLVASLWTLTSCGPYVCMQLYLYLVYRESYQ